MRYRALAVVAALFGAGLVLPAVAAADPPPAAPGAFFHSMSPTRVADTRVAKLPGESGGFGTLDLSSYVPANATAVVFNLTATNAVMATHITVWPHGAPTPPTSNLNVAAGDTRPNQVTVGLSPDHKVDFFDPSASADLIVDLGGYYAAGAGSGFVAPTPQRVFDTRWPQYGSPVGPNSSVTVDLSQWVPATATAVVFNLTATDATDSTYVTAWPDGSPRPSASSMNLAAGAVRPNLVTVAVPPSRKVDLYNHVGSVDLIMDLAGYYAPNAGDAFFPMDPDRVVDTRSNTGLGALRSGDAASLKLNPPLPPTADAVVSNMTGLNATDPTYLAAWPETATRPAEGSVLNLVPGETAANQAVVALDQTTRGIKVADHVGSMDLIVDIDGYFGPVTYTCTTSCTYAWGDNTSGALGIGTTSNAVVSPQPAAAAAATQIVGTSADSFYLNPDGTVSSAGYDGYGQLGRNPHDGEYQNPAFNLERFVPTSGLVRTYAPNPGSYLSGVRAVAGYGDSVETVKSDGTVWGWGYNEGGELGSGGFGPEASPVQATGVTGVTGIAMAHFDTYAVKSDGTVWGWGGTDNWMLPANSPSYTPVQIPGISGATAVGASATSGYALAADGSVWAWGKNDYGQLGQGTSGNGTSTPTKIPGLTGVVALSSGGLDFEYALKSDGTVWTWGRMTPGGSDFSATPVQVPGLSGVTQIAVGTYFAMALKSDGTVWAWGADYHGELGDGLASNDVTRSTPAQVPGLAGITRIGAGGEHAYAVKG
jgi:alpha-tubulin suppressor-like RCC1 family protein